MWGLLLISCQSMLTNSPKRRASSVSILFFNKPDEIDLCVHSVRLLHIECSSLEAFQCAKLQILDRSDPYR